MVGWIDVRIPLIFGEAGDAGAEDALLIAGDAAAAGGAVAWFDASAATGHAAGCACCMPRHAAGQALSRLLLARARGEVRFFRRVVAVVPEAAARQAVLDALTGDPIASGCFRLEGTSATV